MCVCVCVYFSYRISGVTISAASESDGSLLPRGTKPDDQHISIRYIHKQLVKNKHILYILYKNESLYGV